MVFDVPSVFGGGADVFEINHPSTHLATTSFPPGKVCTDLKRKPKLNSHYKCFLIFLIVSYKYRPERVMAALDQLFFNVKQ